MGYYPLRPTPLAVALLALVLTGGCGGGGGTDNPKTVTAPPILVLTTVSVSLPSAMIEVGQTVTASAAGLDQNGAAIGIGTVTWSTGSPTVATVSGAGVVTAVAPGLVSITATVNGRTGSASLTVIPVPVATVSLTPAIVSLVIGATQQLSVAILDGGGNALSGRAVSWATSNSAVGTVSSTGVVTGVAIGTTTITATSDGKSGTATITVIPPPVATVTLSPGTASVPVGLSQQFTATTLAAGGAVLTGRTITWGTSDATRATVSTSGLVTGVAVGSAVISASSEGKTASAAVTVTSPISTALFTNYLIGNIRVYTSAATLGTISAQSSSSFATGGLTTVNYQVLPLYYIDGTAIPADYGSATWSNVTAGSSWRAVNVVGGSGGGTYFAPVITNTGTTTIAIEIRNSNGIRCISTFGNGQYQLPYYLFDTSAEIRAYAGSSCSGSYRGWSNSLISGLIELNSGRTALSYP